MIDRERGIGRGKVRESRQRHLRSGAGDHVNALQRVGRELILGIDLHHHVILIQGLVDGRDLLLAERVVEHGIDLLRRDAQRELPYRDR